jgi:hypothetical protein
MAENARELGLSYDDEPKIGCVNHDCDKCKAVQEPVAMRMPKVGDRVVCIEDESLGTVVYLTAGGSPEIKFDDGSHGTYMLREFADLFGYITPPAAQKPWVGLTDAEVMQTMSGDWTSQFYFARAIEAKLREKNT